MRSHLVERSKLASCPGRYCGYSNSSIQCGVSTIVTLTSDRSRVHNSVQACPRGYSVNNDSVCQLCHEPLSLYNFMYIVFMALLALSFHCYFIHRLQKKKQQQQQREFTLVKYVRVYIGLIEAMAFVFSR